MTIMSNVYEMPDRFSFNYFLITALSSDVDKGFGKQIYYYLV